MGWKNLKLECQWEQYRQVLAQYNSQIRKARRRSRRSFCVDVQKVFAREYNNELGHLQKANGNFIGNSGGASKLMLITDLPVSTVSTGKGHYHEMKRKRPSKEILSLLRKILGVTYFEELQVAWGRRYFSYVITEIHRRSSTNTRETIQSQL
ncbi:hypothetical protein Trydic_g12770 [Trypoxylus dichotomus]